MIIIIERKNRTHRAEQYRIEMRCNTSSRREGKSGSSQTGKTDPPRTGTGAGQAQHPSHHPGTPTTTPAAGSAVTVSVALAITATATAVAATVIGIGTAARHLQLCPATSICICNGCSDSALGSVTMANGVTLKECSELGCGLNDVCLPP